ncbi:MAG: metal-dependent transcriptional regulator [Desulfurococcales archaeon]|nr:metal-dependent transcriptional regulator [Desulfurococcales archaeon]
MENRQVGRIELLKKAHQGRKGLASMSEEDYIEAIYEVEKVYGYARVTDISEILGVRPPTVLGMVKRLEEKGMVIHERHRGVRLTEEGRRVAERIARSHELIRSFLIGIGVDEERANIEAELIEHFLSQETLEKLMRVYEECVKRPSGRASPSG